MQVLREGLKNWLFWSFVPRIWRQNSNFTKEIQVETLNAFDLIPETCGWSEPGDEIKLFLFGEIVSLGVFDHSDGQTSWI